MRNSTIMRKYLIDHPNCENCGKPSTEVHHKLPKVMGGTEIDTNLIALCLDCHNRFHENGYTRSELTKLGIQKSRTKMVTPLISLEEALYQIRIQECRTAIEVIDILLSLDIYARIDRNRISDISLDNLQ